MSKQRTKLRFESVKERDIQLKAFRFGTYEVDKKNPLVVYLNF